MEGEKGCLPPCIDVREEIEEKKDENEEQVKEEVWRGRRKGKASEGGRVERKEKKMRGR